MIDPNGFVYDFDMTNFGLHSRTILKKEKIKNILEYPPSNQQELIYSLTEYMKSDYFQTPISQSLLKNNFYNANKRFKECRQKVLEGLDFDEALKLLSDQGVIEIINDCIGSRLEMVILQCNKNKCLELAREYHTYKPSKMPITEVIPERVQQAQQDIEENIYMFDLRKPTQSIQLEQVQSLDTTMCEYETRLDCYKIKQKIDCQQTHYFNYLQPQTDETLGYCQDKILTQKCYQTKCKYLHLKKEPEDQRRNFNNLNVIFSAEENWKNDIILDKQWINCDLRNINLSILGKFDAIMLDPPWDIHMTLPYSTLKDTEMLALKVEALQDNGVIFLWVTTRALELGRECLNKWGYIQIEELVWIKTNPQRKIIRTGKTGHWLNHSKEHCLVGMKGDISNINKNVDCDVLVSEVRETSRKPDEIYDLIERMVPGGRKVELFARPHNRRKGWLSLGNQLPGVYIYEKEVINGLKEQYPDVNFDNFMEKGLQIDNNNSEFLRRVYQGHLM